MILINMPIYGIKYVIHVCSIKYTAQYIIMQKIKMHLCSQYYTAKYVI